MNFVLSTDPFHPRRKTHKLKGDLQYSWACSAGDDIQIVISPDGEWYFL